MGNEYKKLDSEQILYAQKSILQAQLESLTSVKQMRNYKALRHEELVEKIKLKKLIEEVKQEIDVLFRSLPEPSYPEEEFIEAPEKKSQRNSLEQELDEIKAKLSALQ